MPSCETRRSSFRTVRYGVTGAQNGLQVLVDDEARPDQPREADHQREQPHDPGDAGLVGEHDLEVREIDLRLHAGRRLEADFERLDGLRPDLADGALHRRVPAGIAPLSQFPPQPDGGEAGIGCKPLAQIRQKRIGAPLLWRPWAVGRRLQAACDAAADRLAVHAELAGDRRNGQSLPMKVQDHHEFPEFDHRAAPSRQGEQHRDDSRRLTSRGMPREVSRHDETGENSRPINGEDSTPAHTDR